MDEELHPNLFKPLLDFIPYFESNRKKYNCSEEMSFTHIFIMNQRKNLLNNSIIRNLFSRLIG